MVSLDSDVEASDAVTDKEHDGSRPKDAHGVMKPVVPAQGLFCIVHYIDSKARNRRIERAARVTCSQVGARLIWWVRPTRRGRVKSRRAREFIAYTSGNSMPASYRRSQMEVHVWQAGKPVSASHLSWC